MVMAGRFNERSIDRRFYGKGSIVVVLDGVMANQKVKLVEDVLPQWRGNRKIAIEINGIKAVIEIHKLAL